MSVGGHAPVRFGFLGAGWIAHRALAPAVHAATGAVLQTVAARDPVRAGELEPVGPSHHRYQDLIEDPDVEVVYVNLTNESHHRWTLAALGAGKHVLCEKPLALDRAQVEEMVTAARAADRLLVEAMCYRWHPRTQRLEHLLREGDLGPVQEVEAEFSFDGGGQDRMAGNYRLDPARGGGALYDVGCYAVSAAHLVLGGSLRVVQAESVIGPTGVDLAAAAELRAVAGGTGGAGARAVLRCGITGPDRQILQVRGRDGGVDFSAGEAFTNWHAPSTLSITLPDGVRRDEQFAPVDAYRLMVEAVAARVRGEGSFIPEHSAQVADTLDAIRAEGGSAPRDGA